jgi:small subunit ribosomal protein S1
MGVIGMNKDAMRHDVKPVSQRVDEGYWSALLREGENATTAYLDHNDTAYTDEHADAAEQDDYSVFHPSVMAEDWQSITEITQKDETVTLLVVGYNRGGLLVEYRSLRGFVPASQLLDFPSTAQSTIRRHALADRVGQTATLRIIELDVDKNRLILSERAAQAEPGERQGILNTLHAGDIVEGHITNLCDFGAFVDLGGLEGLIHISEISWGRVAHPDHVLQRSQVVKAYVLGVDQSAGRIALSLKRLRPDPWKTVHERYQIGQNVTGLVTNVVDFGAFVCIEEGLEALIHVSELAEGHFLHPRNVLNEGETVKARILTINGPARRLGLSLRPED